MPGVPPPSGLTLIDALFLRLGLPSTLIRHENAALFLRLGLPSTLICHENVALFLRLGLPSTLIRHENAALFLRLGLPSTLIRHENAALFLRLGLPSTLIRHENAAFRKRWHHGHHVISLTKVSSNSNSEMTGFFFRRSVDGKHMMRFQSENAAFRFLWRSVNGA